MLNSASRLATSYETPEKLSVFSFARLGLMSLVLLTMIFIRQEVLGAEAVIRVYTVLFVSFALSFLQVWKWDDVLKIKYYVASQLLYDLLFTSYLVYLTGVNESVFLFLYLFNIVFSAITYQLNGALLVALSSGTLYAILYYTNTNTDSPGAWYNLAHNELLFLLAALLCGQLMSELKKQKELLESQKENISRLQLLNQQIMTSIPLGIIVIDENDYVENINKTAMTMLEIPSMPEFRIKYYELIPSIKGISSKWERLSEVERLRFQFKIHEKDTTSFSFMMAKLSQREGDTQKQMLIFQDVSKLIELESKLHLESKLAAIGQLSAGIAHEIRNPLASISGCIEILSQQISAESKEEHKLIQIALREIRRLSKLITEFLEFAKPKANSFSLIKINEVIEEIKDAVLANTQLKSKPEILLEIDSSIHVYTDKEKVKQVFLNLFLNSIEAQKGEQVRITVKARYENKQTHIDIIDNGPGIPQENRSRIFTPFFTTKQDGTGLGLASVAQIIKALKGEILLAPSNGGTHFQITLPDAEGAQAAG